MNNLKSNYKNQHKNNLTCTLCNGNEMESETHLVRCPEILSEFNLGINVDYMDIYGTLGKQIEAVKIFKKIFRVRTWKLENRKLVHDGPQVHHQSASCAHDDPLPVDYLALDDTPSGNLSLYVHDFGN